MYKKVIKRFFEYHAVIDYIADYYSMSANALDELDYKRLIEEVKSIPLDSYIWFKDFKIKWIQDLDDEDLDWFEVERDA